VSNTERRERIKYALGEAGMAAVICALPTQVFLLSGYWPVVGTALAIATRHNEIIVVAPEDEKEIAQASWADAVETFRPGSLDALTNAAEAVSVPLARIAKRLGINGGSVGYESATMFEPASYAALHLYGADMVAMIHRAFPSVSLVPADAMLARLRAVKTSYEVNAIRRACRISECAFSQGASQLRPGMTELDAAELFRGVLSTAITNFPDVERADGYIFCMSGPNSALASGAYARSRTRRIVAGDLVLVHCNSYADGYWTDITRTYSCGEPDSRAKAIRDAIFAAREAALRAIAPGAAAADVDHAAREVLQERGFGPQFKHSTGHGVGFAAIDNNAQPRLHPASPDTIQAGMVFNVEPAVYINNFGGVRHCDMVAITKTGTELLTNFQCRPEDLVLRDG